MTNDGPDRTLPPDDAGQIDALRDEFERAYLADKAPLIEEYLDRIGERLRPAAFRELLRTEVNLRRSRQEQVNSQEFLTRFPNWAAAIRDACLPPRDEDGTLNQTPGKRRSGLHVRCPHCRNPIELVPDAELEGITCGSCGSQFSLTGGDDQATRDARTVVQIGHFKLVERLGMGAFGTVWKAQDLDLDRTVAVKIPRSGQLDKQQQDFFLREARSAAQLRHPNIVPVYEVGREGDTLFIVSEFVRGITLADRLTAGPMSAHEAAKLCVKIAEALHHAHEHGVIHRDLKPANVMLDAQGDPHLMDFGLARREANEITMTFEGQVLGTPAYMSPEQAQGEAHVADRRSDIYSLGVILFELLTGELPFRGNARMMIHQVIHDVPPNPRKLSSAVPRDLDTITMRCLEKSPAKRFENTRDLAEEFGRYLRNEPILSRPITPLGRGWRWCCRKPLVAALGAAVAMLVLIVAVGGPIMAVRESLLRSIAEENERAAIVAQQEAQAATIAMRDEAAKILFVHGNSEYIFGSMQTGCEEIFRAWTLISASNSLKPAYERILVDRLTRGQQPWVPMRHEDGVTSVAFSPDGQRILTGSDDNTARLWDAATGQPLGEPMRHKDDVMSVAFSPDGQYVVTGSRDETARLWDAATGQPVGKPMDHLEFVSFVAFSPDGKRILTKAFSTVQLWNAATCQPVGKPMYHDSESVSAVAFSADGLRILTGSDNKKAQLWDGVTGEPLGNPLRHEDGVTSVAFSPDGQRVLTGSGDNTARLWDAATGQPIGEPMRHQGTVRIISSVAFSPDGQHVLTGGTDNTVRLWDAATGRPTGKPMRQDAAVEFVAFSPDGQSVVTLSSDNTVRLWDAVAGQPLGEPMRHESRVSSVAVSPDGQRILTGSYDATARLWDAATGQPLGEPIHHEGVIVSLAFSPDGQHVVTGSSDQTARLWDTVTGQPIGEPMRQHSTVWSTAFSPNGQRVLTGSDDNCAQQWNAATGQPIGDPMRNRGFRVSCVAFSPDGQRVLTGSYDATARLWDAATGQPIGKPMRHDDGILTVAFSPDGQYVLTGSDYTIAQVWDIATGKRIGNPIRPQSSAYSVTSVAFSPDRRRVLTGADDNTARLWDLATGQLIGEPMRHKSRVTSVAFSLDGHHVLTGSDDNTARLWDAATGQPLGEPMRHKSRVSSVAVSPDGERALTGSDDDAVRQWDISCLPTPQGKLAWYELLIGKRLVGDQCVELSAEEIDKRWALVKLDQAWMDAMHEFRKRRAQVVQLNQE